ncbi:MAG TPA: hypothetical protein GX702_11745, partial [Chloroflexi bacterium]|nr:hypothetical protein [Chloroflexota bacterium]
MEIGREGHKIPAHIQGMFSLLMTLVAAALYVMVLGGAIVRTVLENQPYFSENMVRAAGLLSGLVGAVVTAGFARSGQPGMGPISVRRRNSSRSFRARSLVRRKLLSLAETLGLPVPTTTTRTRDDLQPEPDEPTLPPQPIPDEEEADTPRDASAPMWVALLYFAVYFIVGASAFVVSIWRQDVPDIISNAGWVWLGTIISSAYAF